MSFLDCKATPAQEDYPECYTYSFMPGEGSRECHLDLVVSGFPGVLEQYPVRIEAAPDGRIFKVVLASEPGAFGMPLARPARPGAVLGVITVRDERATGFVAKQIVPAYHRGRTLSAGTPAVADHQQAPAGSVTSHRGGSTPRWPSQSSASRRHQRP